MLRLFIMNRRIKEQFTYAPALTQPSILQDGMLDRALKLIGDIDLLIDVKADKFKIDAAENGAVLGWRQTLHLAAP